MRISRLLLALALFHAGTALASPADVERFYSSGYTYCDAKILAEYWHIDRWDAKIRAGQKLGAGGASVLESVLGTARSAASEAGGACTFLETEFGSDEALVLARHWGLTVHDTKTRVATKVTWGHASFVRSQLAEARGIAPPVAPDPGEGHLAAFFGSTYTYCDATLIATLWKQTTGEAKATIGRKVAAGITDSLEMSLESARAALAPTGFRCLFHESEYTWEDARALSDLWGMTPAETKTRVENKLFYGGDAIVKAELQRAREQQ